ncbi:hypothetical protein VitviT2T_013531 [Vitis vinifera]|nr:hypothetical protein VitviT2T_013531 [Vitis vinifera]
MLAELARREKTSNIKLDPDINVFMKAVATEGQKKSVVTDHIMKILGLDICADIMVGDEMIRGIFGGQRKRVTTGEMLVGPSKALFMDEISTGLDNSTTCQIVNSLRQTIHILNGIAVISLFQPPLETCDFFYDIILLFDSHIVYQGPRENVTSRKDHEQYWTLKNEPYRFAIAKEFVEAFQSFHVGEQLAKELATPINKAKSHPTALTTKKYGISKKELLVAYLSREHLLMKRNSFVYILKLIQMASALFRLIASTGRNMIVANTFGSFATLLLFALGGFVLSRERLEERGQVISSAAVRSRAVVEANQNKKKGTLLPFQPHSITFDNIRYSVDMPQGVLEDRLELLKGVSGAFRPGVLTALMGVSGAGKITLMDVLAGRKTGGYIEGNITISGYLKKKETFARISRYCAQNDIHSPHVTVYESLVYSAWLRLPSDVDSAARKMFIDEVMELMELTPLKGALVGLPVAPDEARRTRDISGTTGELKESVKIKESYNPATWMLEVTTTAQEVFLGVDFKEIYKNSDLFR